MSYFPGLMGLYLLKVKTNGSLPSANVTAIFKFFGGSKSEAYLKLYSILPP